MSTENTPAQDEVLAPADAATPVEQGATPVNGDNAEVVAPDPVDKKKLQLNPTGSENAKAIPSVEGGPSNPEPVAPVAIPSASDSDIEAAIAAVVGAAPAASATSASATDSVTNNATESQATAPASNPAATPRPKADGGFEAIEASIDAAIQEAIKTGETAPTAAAVSVETLKPGQRLTGTVQSIHGDSVLVDFGLRYSGAVPYRQFDPKALPNVGDSIELVFDNLDEAQGLIIANRPRGTSQVRGDWDAIAPDQVVECMVTKVNKGGLEVTVSKLRGFIPASQVEMGFVADLETYVGQKLRVRVTEVNPAKRKLVLSRRALLAEERDVAKTELLAEIQPDQTRTGRVKTIKDYGAFIDLGGMDGFLPVAQMSWVRIGHPNEILSEGQEIEVKVLSIDREKNRIGLGMRQLSANPWRSAEDKYAKGSNVTGRVTRVEAFGAFVELEPGVEGLVHISELEHRRVKKVTEVLNPGDTVEVQILEVDPKKKRISLSAKALKEKPADAVSSKEPEVIAPYERKRREPLKGGTGDPKKRGGLFGNPNDFTK